MTGGPCFAPRPEQRCSHHSRQDWWCYGEECGPWSPVCGGPGAACWCWYWPGRGTPPRRPPPPTLWRGTSDWCDSWLLPHDWAVCPLTVRLILSHTLPVSHIVTAPSSFSHRPPRGWETTHRPVCSDALCCHDVSVIHLTTYWGFCQIGGSRGSQHHGDISHLGVSHLGEGKSQRNGEKCAIQLDIIWEKCPAKIDIFSN